MDKIATTILTPIVRHGLTYVAGTLVTLGLLDSSQSANFITIGAGFVAGLIGLAWSLYKNKK